MSQCNVIGNDVQECIVPCPCNITTFVGFILYYTFCIDSVLIASGGATGNTDGYGADYSSTFELIHLVDPDVVTCEPIPDYPHPISSHSISSHRGGMVICGGKSDLNTNTYSDCYKHESNTWTWFVAMPWPRYEHGSLQISDDEFMILGGESRFERFEVLFETLVIRTCMKTECVGQLGASGPLLKNQPITDPTYNKTSWTDV